MRAQLTERQIPVSDAIPIAEGLFEGPREAPVLLASRCRRCGELAFPAQPSCAACPSADTEPVQLSRRGTLWTWTVQRFPPPSPPFAGDPDAFVPFGVGYVELPEGIRIEGRLTENDPDKLAIGMEMELVLEPFDRDAEGRERLTFAFAPVGTG